MNDGVKCFDHDWCWGTVNNLETDRGMIYAMFINWLKRNNQLRQMKKFKIIGFDNIKEENETV